MLLCQNISGPAARVRRAAHKLERVKEGEKGKGALTKLWRSGSVDEVLGQSAFVSVVLRQQLSELQSILLVSALLLLLGHVPIEPIAGNKTIGDVQRLRAHRSVWSAPRQTLRI